MQVAPPNRRAEEGEMRWESFWMEVVRPQTGERWDGSRFG